MEPLKPSNPFPMEAIFPGIHKLRPDIAAQDAEAFLAYGHKTGGFDLDDPQTRADMLDGPSVTAPRFIRFKIKPRPDIQKLLEALPFDWEEHPSLTAQADAIMRTVDELYDLPRRGLYVYILEGNELWVCRGKRPE